jgi:hypothetical protein
VEAAKSGRSGFGGMPDLPVVQVGVESRRSAPRSSKNRSQGDNDQPPETHQTRRILSRLSHLLRRCPLRRRLLRRMRRAVHR